MVRIFPIQQLAAPIPISRLIGDNGSMNQIVTSLGDSKIFTDHGNLIGNSINELKRVITDVVDTGVNQIKKVMNAITNPGQAGYVPIINEAMLTTIPDIMIHPIMTYAPVRELFMDGKLHGFGYTPDTLPTTDPWGRLIDNGTLEIDSCGKHNKGKQLVWEYYDDDPVHTIEDLEAVESTRDFIDHYLATEMKKESPKDITDFPNCINC
jgi:phage tail protein X